MTPNEELHAGATSGDPARVAAALAAGAEVNSEDCMRTALSMACAWGKASEGHLECVKLLLAAGADHRPERRRLDWTPLHWAAMKAPDGHAQFVAVLLAAGADPVARDIYGEVPLHYAARHGHLEAARLLAEAAPSGAVMVRSCYGNTPLHFALEAGHISLASYLLGGVRLSSLEVDNALSTLRQCIYRGETRPLQWLQALPALVSRQTLTAQQWERIPSPCLGIGAALPAVLQRSEAEAALPLRCMPESERQRLRTLALCLARGQRSGLLPALPIRIVERVLGEAAAVQAPLHMQAVLEQRRKSWGASSR